jgi:hypothetical protein
MRNHNSPKLIPAVLAAAVVTLSVGACSTSTPNTPAPIDPPSATQAQTTDTFKLGETATVGKFAVSLSPLDGYKPGDYAAGYTGGAATAYTMVVRNDSDTRVELLTLTLTGTQPGGQPAERIFDSANGVDLPTGELFPAETATFKVAFDGEVSRVKVEGFLDWSTPIYFVK